MGVGAAQVQRGDEGLWLREHPELTEPGDYPYGMHSGIGGLAHAVEEIRLKAATSSGASGRRGRSRAFPK
jgi:hypothetical protein